MKAILRVSRRCPTAYSMTLVIMAVVFVSCGDDDEVVNPSTLNPPSNVLAVTQSLASVKLTWTNSSSGATGIRVERANGLDAPFEFVETVSANQSNYLDDNLVWNATYKYRLLTIGVEKQSDPSDIVIAITSLPDAPLGLTVSGFPDDETKATVKWIDNSYGEGGFVLKCESSDGATQVLEVTLDPNTTMMDIGDLEPGTAYNCFLRAFNGAGDSDEVKKLYGVSAAPHAPSDLTLVDVDCVSDPRRMVVSWQDHSTIEDGFEIQAGGFGWGKWGDVVQSNDGSGEIVTEIDYISLPLRVRAYRGDNFSSPSNELQISPCPS